MLEFLGALFNFLIRLLAALLGILFVVAVVLVLLLVDADGLLLSPNLYLNALDKEQVYNRLPMLAAEQIYLQMHNAGPATWAEGNLLAAAGPEAQSCAQTSLSAQAYQEILSGSRPPTTAEETLLAECGIGAATGSEGGPPAFFQNLTMDQWASVLGALLPPDWLKTQTESILNQAFQVIDTPGAPLQIVISLKEFKERLAGPTGTDVAIQLMKALPPCPADYVPITSDPAQMLACRPTDAQIELAKPQIAQAIAGVSVNLPDSLDLLQPLRTAGVLTFDASSLPAGPRQLLQIGRWVVRLSPILCLALLLLIALLVVRSWKGLLRWWGFPIFCAGLAALIVAIAAWIGLDVLISFGRQNIPANISPSLFDTGAAVLVFVVHRLVLILGGEGIFLGVAGLVMVIISFFIGRHKPPPAEQIARPQTNPSASPQLPQQPPTAGESPGRGGIFD